VRPKGPCLAVKRLELIGAVTQGGLGADGRVEVSYLSKAGMNGQGETDAFVSQRGGGLHGDGSG
jgi:hypothetical protein